jgi:hypothetical protein
VFSAWRIIDSPFDGSLTTHILDYRGIAAYLLEIRSPNTQKYDVRDGKGRVATLARNTDVIGIFTDILRTAECTRWVALSEEVATREREAQKQVV